MKKRRRIINFNELNIDSLYLTKDLFKILKDLKSRNNISHWFKYDTVFANVNDEELSDILKYNFLQVNDTYTNVDFSTIINLEKKEVKIITQHFINTILIYSFLKKTQQPEFKDINYNSFIHNLYPIFCLSNMRFSDLLTTYNGANSNFKTFNSSRLFWDIYFIICRKSELRNNSKRLLTDQLAYKFYYIFVSQFNYYRPSNLLSQKFNYQAIYQNILNEFTDVLNLIEYDLNKSKLYRDCITGLIIRFHEKINVYNDSLNNFHLKERLIFKVNNDSHLYTYSNNVRKINAYHYATDCEVHFQKLGLDKGNYKMSDFVDLCSPFYFVAYSKDVAVIDNDPCIKNLTITKLRDNGGHLRDYSSKEYTDLPLAILPYQTNKNPLTLGYELECFFTRKNRDDSTNQKNLIKNIESEFTNHTAICKYDGSLGNNGIEIVSAVMSYEYILFTNYFENLYNHIKTELYSYSSNSSGFHIHLNKSFFTSSEILKIIKILNTRRYKNFFSEIAGRPIDEQGAGNDYYYYDSYDYSATRTAQAISLYNKIKSGFHRSRYLLLNTNNEHTIEFRLFKGNIKPDTILRYIQLAVSLAYYVKTVSFTHTNIATYWNFLETNKHEYSVLFDFISSKFETAKFFNDTITSRTVSAGGTSVEDETTSKSLVDIQHKFTKKFRAVRFELPKVLTAPELNKKKARRVYSLSRQQQAI